MHHALEREVQESKSHGRTTEPLRRFVLGIVDECLQEHYGNNYSILCFQGSMAIATVLEELGIKATIKNGHMCVIQAKMVNDEPEPFWAGFFDENDHAWVQTEFGEIVDLTISHLSYHPLAVNAVFPTPAVWWIDGARWPNFLKYLPQGNAVPDFSPEELDDKENLLQLVRRKVKSRAEEGIAAGYQGAVFSGQDSYKQLGEEGHLWVTLAAFAGHLPLPAWVQNRINELDRGCSNPTGV